MAEVKQDKDLEVLTKHVADMMRMYDTVQIMATRHDASKNETLTFTIGKGNLFARIAQADMWVQEQKMPDYTEEDK